MIINLDYLKKFIEYKYNKQDLKELLASIGIEVNEMIEIDGTDVFEVEITPNRPDWLSHYGIAREIHAKNPSLSLKIIETDRKKSIGKSDFDVEIKDRTGCSRYSGVILNNVKVGKSSPRLTSLIESFGMRPVNNIVDISNLVLMTYGHPIHIFDLDKITGDKIIIRSAEKDEVITLLDGMVKKLDVADLVIADENKSIAVAGVMGEEHSGVSEKTVNIFIESAWFDPSRVRITSKKMGMKTEASYLFERGADVENTSRIIDLTIDRIEEELGYQPEIIQYFDEYPEKLKKQIVELDKDFPEKFTGIQISEKASTEILESLGFKLEDEKTKWKVEVPSFRVDINKHEDLVEEIIRIYGYDKLDTTLPATAVNSVEKYEKRGFLDKIRSHFAANGYSEVINYSFHSLKDNSFFGDDSQNVELRNPIGSDYSVMRNSLLSGILKNTATNSNNDFRRISLFESGTVFSREGNKLIEKDLICISSSGFETLPNWHESEGRVFDFFLFKSHIFGFLKKAGIEIELKYEEKFKGFLKGECCYKIMIDGAEAGFIGEVENTILNYYKNNDPVFVCQLDMDVLTEKNEKKNFKMWNRFPTATRDLSFLIDREYKFEKISKTIKKYKPEDLEDYSLAGLYEGKGIPPEKISIFMNFKYRNSDRTLTNDEVNELHDLLVNKLVEDLGIIRR